MEIVLSIALAIGLAAACGFRVFLPLFAVSVMSYIGVGIPGLSENFAWLGTLPAMIAFGGASLLEIAAYYIPVVDNLLDSAAVPLAAASGTIVSMSTMMDMEPLVQWSIALIAGGGVAGLIKGMGAGTRLASTATTGGMANPVVSTVETGASIGMVLLSIFLPILALIGVGLLLFFVLRWLKRRRAQA